MCSLRIEDKVHAKGIELKTIVDHRNNVVIIFFYHNESQTNHHPLYLIPEGMVQRESRCPTCHIPNGCDEVLVEVFSLDIPNIEGLQGLQVKISGEGLYEERIVT